MVNERGVREVVREAGRLAELQGEGGGVTTSLQVTGYLTEAIETLGEGDVVLTRDELDPAAPMVLTTMARLMVNVASELLHVTVRSSNGETQTLTTTAEHPVWIDGRGWVDAGHLDIGDGIGDAGGASTVVGLRTEWVATGTRVFNLRVPEGSTYFVREEGSTAEPVWVHNGYEILNKVDEVAKTEEIVGTYPEGVGEYKDVGGHHPLSGKAFDYQNYDKSIAIGRDYMLSKDWGHPHPLTSFQQQGYVAFGKTGESLTITRMAQIEIDAMVKANIPRSYAEEVTSSAIWQRLDQGETTPLNIPWVGRNPGI